MQESKYRGRIGFQTKQFEVNDLNYNEDSRIISGYAAIFGNIDKAGDLLVKGCFAKSIAERGPESQANDKIIFLWMHDMSEPLGKITALKEDDRGLYFEASIDEIELGDRAITQLKSGTLNQFSIGYRYVWDKCEWIKEEDKEIFICKELILNEISVVSIGCNGETEFLGFKSDIDPYEEFQKEINSALKGVENRTEIEKLITKAISLGKSEPRKSLVKEEPKAGIFNNVKFKTND